MDSAELRIELVDTSQGASRSSGTAPPIGVQTPPSSSGGGGVVPPSNQTLQTWGSRRATPVELISPLPLPVRIVGDDAGGSGNEREGKRRAGETALTLGDLGRKAKEFLEDEFPLLSKAFVGAAAVANILGTALQAAAKVVEYQTNRQREYAEEIQKVAGRDYLGALGTAAQAVATSYKETAEMWRDLAPKGGAAIGAGIGMAAGPLGAAVGAGIGYLGGQIVGSIGGAINDLKAASAQQAALGVQMFTGLASTLVSQAQRLGEYNPQLAGASAMFEVRSELRDMRLAQDLGPNLSRFLDRFSQLLDKLQEVMTPVLQQIVDMMTSLTKEITGIISELAPQIRQLGPVIAAFIKMKIEEAIKLLQKLAEHQGIRLDLSKKRDAREEAAAAAKRAMDDMKDLEDIWNGLQNQLSLNRIGMADEQPDGKEPDIPIFGQFALGGA